MGLLFIYSLFVSLYLALKTKTALRGEADVLVVLVVVVLVGRIGCYEFSSIF